jgi:hypothetical protein
MIQMRITTQEELTPEQEDPPGLCEVFDYLQLHQTFPRIIQQDFPSGTRQLSILVIMDIGRQDTLHMQIHRVNKKYCGRGVPLVARKVQNDEAPAFTVPSFAPPLSSSM